MDLNTTWFMLIGVLIIGYAILDGFDLGVGVLHLFAAKTDEEKRIHLNAIGPVWDGNQVWLLTGGGALFAAFPVVYATVFSGFYLALMLVLLGLILRAVSMKFRGGMEDEGWKKVWDLGFGVGSLIALLIFGVAVGNILKGIPIEVDGHYAGQFFGLLNPPSLLVGVLSVVLFTMHGALYMTLKTDGDLRDRMHMIATRLYGASLILYLLATVYYAFIAPYLFRQVASFNLLVILLMIVFLVSFILIPVLLGARKYFQAFLSSCVFIAALIGVVAINLYPMLVPSSLDLAYSLTIYNSSSTPRTLLVMLIIALIGMPLVIGYSVYIYRVFKGKVVIDSSSY